MTPTRHLRPENLRGLRWRGYLRESTQAQADRGAPLDRQRADIERAAAELGMVPAPPLWYERVGSGEKERAPELQAALAGAQRKEYDVLVVFHSSRLARDTVEAGLVKREFAKAGAILYFASQRLISGTYTGALTEGVSAVIDAYENETRRMFIAGGQRERMLAGKWVGAIPFGYRKTLADRPDGTRGWDGGLAADEARAPIVRRIFALLVGGTDPLTIIRTLNAEGVPGPQGGPWGRTMLVKMLRNPVYKGVLSRYRHIRPSLHYFPEDDPQDGRREVEGQIEPLGVEWDEAQTILDADLIHHRRRYPLTNLIRCDECGRVMSGVSNGYSRYYRCRPHAGDRSCAAPFIRADAVEGTYGVDDWGALPEDEYRVALAKLRAELRWSA